MRWFIDYRTAAWVGLKAAWFAVLAAIAVVLAFAFAGVRDEQFLDAMATLVAILAWWLAHTNGLLKLRANRVLTPAEARALSANVFGYWLVGLFLFLLAVVLVALLVSRVL